MSLVNVYIMYCALSFFCWKCSYDTYKFIYNFSSFQFNYNLMLWWADSGFSVNPQSILMVLDLVSPLVPCSGYHLVTQPFLRKIMVSSICIPFVLSITICMYMSPESFLLVLLVLYVRTVCSPVHQLLFCTFLFPHSIAS